MYRSKGGVETMVVLVLLALIGNTALLSVGIGGFENILGMSADSNDAQAVENKIYKSVRNVCVQGTNADERVNSFTFSSKINVTLVSEKRDPLNDQTIRAIMVENNVQLLETDKISDCVIEFGGDADNEMFHVFKKGDPYQVTISNEGTEDDKPATLIDVEAR